MNRHQISGVRMELAKTVTMELQKIPTWAKNIGLVLGASILLGLFAHVVIPLPFSPIPIVLQVSLVLLLSVLLGSKKAVAAVLAFLGQGAMGLPVFAGGAAGIPFLCGPKAGYYFGYLIAAYVTGRLIEISGKKSLFHAALAMFAGNILIYLFGAAWLATFIGANQALLLGVAPFIVGDFVKVACGLKFLQWIGWNRQ